MYKKPEFSEQIDDHYLLWFESSNSYSLVDDIFYKLLQHYFRSRTKEEFVKQLEDQYDYSADLSEHQYRRIEEYLQQFDIASESVGPPKTFINNRTFSSKYYTIGKQSVQLSFNEEKVLNLIHPMIAHLETESQDHIKLQLFIRYKDDELQLQKNENPIEIFPSSEYHKLQGRILFHLINLLHDTDEKDWMGLFHASAVSYKGRGLLFMGSSGSGKSTLVSLLSAHGFALLADDTVPIKSGDQHLYLNPSAVSVKEAALPLVQTFWPHTQSHTPGIVTKGKGNLTYIPMQEHLHTVGVPCSAVIRVNYQKDTPTQLTPLDIKSALETLIPESWISPNPQNAKSFMDWLTTVQFYELSYSDFQEVLPLLKSLK